MNEKTKYKQDDIEVDEAAKKILGKFHSKMKKDELIRSKESMAKRMTAKSLADSFLLQCEKNEISLEELELVIKELEIHYQFQLKNMIAKSSIKVFLD